jgi:hypothetical protein
MLSDYHREVLYLFEGETTPLNRERPGKAGLKGKVVSR